MEVFGYHPDLKKWTEIGNSGMFRPEMLLPMGLPKVSERTRRKGTGQGRAVPRSGLWSLSPPVSAFPLLALFGLFPSCETLGVHRG